MPHVRDTGIKEDILINLIRRHRLRQGRQLNNGMRKGGTSGRIWAPQKWTRDVEMIFRVASSSFSSAVMLLPRESSFWHHRSWSMWMRIRAHTSDVGIVFSVSMYSFGDTSKTDCAPGSLEGGSGLRAMRCCVVVEAVAASMLFEDDFRPRDPRRARGFTPEPFGGDAATGLTP